MTLGKDYLSCDAKLSLWMMLNSKIIYYNIQDANGNAVASVHQERMTIEVLSFSDGKEAVAKAASFLCLQYLEGDSVGYNKMEPVFTETDVTNALKAVGLFFFFPYVQVILNLCCNSLPFMFVSHM